MEQIKTINSQSGAAARLPLNNDDLARIAYVSVEGIEFLEMNDGNRLGYHIYLFLTGQLPSIADAIYEAKARTSVHPNDLERLIRERLIAAGAS